MGDEAAKGRQKALHSELLNSKDRDLRQQEPIQRAQDEGVLGASVRKLSMSSLASSFTQQSPTEPAEKAAGWCPCVKDYPGTLFSITAVLVLLMTAWMPTGVFSGNKSAPVSMGHHGAAGGRGTAAHGQAMSAGKLMATGEAMQAISDSAQDSEKERSSSQYQHGFAGSQSEQLHTARSGVLSFVKDPGWEPSSDSSLHGGPAGNRPAHRSSQGMADVLSVAEAPHSCTGEAGQAKNWPEERKAWCCKHDLPGCHYWKGKEDLCLEQVRSHTSVGDSCSQARDKVLGACAVCSFCAERDVCPAEQERRPPAPKPSPTPGAAERSREAPAVGAASTAAADNRPTVRSSYNCDASQGASWPEPQRVWCCANHNVGCTPFPMPNTEAEGLVKKEAPTNGEFQVSLSPINCDNGFMARWSKEHRLMCCEYNGVGCPDKVMGRFEVQAGRFPISGALGLAPVLCSAVLACGFLAAAVLLVHLLLRRAPMRTRRSEYRAYMTVEGETGRPRY